MSTTRGEYYRKDGVRITHDPYSPEMAEKYGIPGQTDNEGYIGILALPTHNKEQNNPAL